MSASPVFSSAAMGRPFIFSPSSSLRTNAEKMGKETAEILHSVGASPILAAVVPASRLDVRPAPEMVSSGIPQLDSLTGGFARGCLTEICGTASSGRTSVLLFALACATQRGEVCALVDASDTFDPASAAAAGMEMNRLLWVRCGDRNPVRRDLSATSEDCGQTGSSYQKLFREDPGSGTCPEHTRKDATNSAQSPSLATESNRDYRKLSKWKNPEVRRWESQLDQMLKVTDLLLQSNGFGMIALDLGNVPVQGARRIPLASWFRFRRVIEHTPTVLLVLEQQPIAGSCSSALMKVSGLRSQASGKQSSAFGTQLKNELTHAELLDQVEITVELLHSRLQRKVERKPVQSTACFHSRAAWAG